MGVELAEGARAAALSFCRVRVSLRLRTPSSTGRGAPRNVRFGFLSPATWLP